MFLNIQWHNDSNSVNLFLYICVFNGIYIFFKFEVNFQVLLWIRWNALLKLYIWFYTNYYVFLMQYLLNQCLCTNISWWYHKNLNKLVVFNGSIAVFRFFGLNINFVAIKRHALLRSNKFQKRWFLDTLGE